MFGNLLCYKIKTNIQGIHMRKRNIDRQREILSLLKSSEKPMSAYQILTALQASEPEIAPPTVYRTLNALTEQGRAHRLESAKAFVPCTCDHVDSVSVLAICADCGVVDEHDGGKVVSKLTPLVAASGFTAKRHVVEIHGLCRGCAA
jgi:Fur family zinc uptake transcriptional regulator